MERMKSQYQNVIFDLDGTLLKTEEGLFDSITYALEQMGVDPGDRKDMKRMIGPVLYESFRKFYNMTAEEAERTNALFYEAYENTGVYNSTVYEGVEDMLRKLQGEGKTLIVVTAKPQNQADTVLHHTGIDRYFQKILGPDRSDRTTDKVTLLNKALSFIAESGTGASAKEDAVMVGDRMFDMEAACEVGLDSIGVLYGYGDRAELEQAGATCIAGTPADVVSIVCEEPQ